MENIPPDLLIYIMKLLDIKSFWFFGSCGKIHFSIFSDNNLWKHRFAIDYITKQPYQNYTERASYKWRYTAKFMAVRLIWSIINESPYFVTIDLNPYLTQALLNNGPELDIEIIWKAITDYIPKFPHQYAKKTEDIDIDLVKQTIKTLATKVCAPDSFIALSQSTL